MKADLILDTDDVRRGVWVGAVDCGPDWCPPTEDPPVRVLRGTEGGAPGMCWYDEPPGWGRAVADASVPGGLRARTEAERAAEGLDAWRAGFVVDAWQGRYILASRAPATEGALAAFPGTTLLDQVDALCVATLAAPELERYRGAKTWRRTDPSVVGLASAIGMDDAAVDQWFLDASLVQ